jgi:hypothetical protein
MYHESEIYSANRNRISYGINVSVLASRGSVLGGVPSWINGIFERNGNCNRDDRTSGLS